MPKITIQFPDEMYAHVINGFDGSADAYERLTHAEQEALFGDRVFAFVASVAKTNAVRFAQEKAARETSLLAEGMIAQTKAGVSIKVEEVSA